MPNIVNSFESAIIYRSGLFELGRMTAGRSVELWVSEPPNPGRSVLGCINADSSGVRIILKRSSHSTKMHVVLQMAERTISRYIFGVAPKDQRTSILSSKWHFHWFASSSLETCRDLASHERRIRMRSPSDSSPKENLTRKYWKEGSCLTESRKM